LDRDESSVGVVLRRGVLPRFSLPRVSSNAGAVGGVLSLDDDDDDDDDDVLFVLVVLVLLHRRLFSLFCVVLVLVVKIASTTLTS
jgi:hypothetical protein